MLTNHRLDGGAVDGGLADFDAAFGFVFAGNEQHVIKNKFGADFGGQFFDLKEVAFGDAVLFTAGGNDCEHGSSSYAEPEAGPTWDAVARGDEIKGFAKVLDFFSTRKSVAQKIAFWLKFGWNRSMQIRFATSPDADDLFMAWPLLTGKVDCTPYFFLHQAFDTESLNERASGDDPPEICAVSIAKVASLADRYWLMAAGVSVGRGYGPVVVTRDGTIGSIGELAGKKVAIPGLSTTAFLVLRILCREHGVQSFEPVVIPIVPFSRVFEALQAREVDAALLIHEGRLTYADDPSLHLVCDIGIEWQHLTGLPLPLGGNVIAKSLGIQRANELNRLLAKSIRFALDHQEQMIDELVSKTSLTRDRLAKYLAMYANHDSLDLQDDAIAAITELQKRGRSLGIFGPNAWAILPHAHV